MPSWINRIIQSNTFVGLVVCAGLLFSIWSLYLSNRSGTSHFDRDAKLEVIENKVFSNQIVDLDGKNFRDCTFLNVTFRYNGTAGVTLEHNRFGGSMQLESANPSVMVGWLVVKGLGFPPSAGVLDLDGHPTYNVEPPSRPNQ